MIYFKKISNLRKIYTEEKLNEATLRALNEEQERMQRLNVQPHLLPPLDQLDDQQGGQFKNEMIDFNLATIEPNFMLQSDLAVSSESSANSSSQSIYVIEDDEPKETKKPKEIDLVELDDDDDDKEVREEEDDDDCRIISESEHQQEVQAVSKRLLRGIHMNDELNKPDMNGQVLINVNHPSEDADVNLLPYLAKNVKTHQIGGIRFMYDNIVESLTRIQNKTSGFGCILAHAMGLGKTFQVISFIELFLRCTCAQRVLCIVPINTIQNWMSEFNSWLPENGQQRIDNGTVINYRRPFKVLLINDFAKTIKQRTEVICKRRLVSYLFCLDCFE